VDVSETGGANQIQPSALLHATHLGGRGGGGGGRRIRSSHQPYRAKT